MALISLGDQVEATVERVFPFGVFVRLETGAQAYIRRRELDLDRDAEPSHVVMEGQSITAVVVSPGGRGKHIELSRRAILPDPWEELVLRFHEGDVVQGTVQTLIPTGIFVRVLPGVNGFVPLAELSSGQVDRPERLLWVGDYVKAIITRLDPPMQKLTLSIKALLDTYSQPTHVSRPPDEQFPRLLPKQSPHDDFDRANVEERQRVGRIIVLDDDDRIRTALVDWLQRYGYSAVAVGTIPEALAEMQAGGIHVLFVDLHLADGSGLDLIRHLRTNDIHSPACVMSTPDQLTEHAAEIQAGEVLQVFEKPLDVDEIDHFLVRLARGETFPMVWHGTSERPFDQPPGVPEFFRGISREVSPAVSMQAALDRLAHALHAEKGILFTMEPTSRKISILAEAGLRECDQQALYKLQDSPVRNVIFDRARVFEGQASDAPRFRKLLDLLTFESCVGIPVQVVDDVHHAVFFFHRKRNAFTRARVRDAMMGAVWLGAILEAQVLEDRMRWVSPLLLSGELAASFAHEVTNKVSGLDIQLRNLMPISETTDLSFALGSLQHALTDLKTVVESFQQTMRTNAGQTFCDVAEIIRRAEILLRPQARREHAQVQLHLAAELPLITGNNVGLQQAFLNVMLNAVQQMTLKGAKQRILQISTRYRTDSSGLPIQVRFADTGPGVHRQLWDKVFALGFSTRGGSGLGLFIARSSIELLGGRISVEDSYLPFGTTFLVELPVAQQGRENEPTDITRSSGR